MKLPEPAVIVKGMTQRKRKSVGERSTLGKHKNPRVVFHPPASLLERLDAYIDAIRPSTDRTAVLVMLIEELLNRVENKGKAD